MKTLILLTIIVLLGGCRDSTGGSKTLWGMNIEATIFLIVCFLVVIGAVGLYLKERFAISQKDIPSFKIPKIKFLPSDWVMFYRICGGILLLVAVIAIFQNQVTSSIYFFCLGLSGFLAAHILSLLERAVHHLENLDNREAIKSSEKESEEKEEIK